jgi:hypothetical protein
MKIHGAPNLKALTTEDTEVVVKEKLFNSNRIDHHSPECHHDAAAVHGILRGLRGLRGLCGEDSVLAHSVRTFKAPAIPFRIQGHVTDCRYPSSPMHEVARHESAHVAEADESDVGHADGGGTGFGTHEFRGNSARPQTGKPIQHNGTDSVSVIYSDLPNRRNIFDKVSVTSRVTQTGTKKVSAKSS